MTPPWRPRLSDSVAARWHVVDGARLVVLQAPGNVICLGEREWEFLAAADGTRDLEGIRGAASRAGRACTLEHLQTFFTDLDRAGLLAEPETPPGDSIAPRRPVRQDSVPDSVPGGRPIVPLPDFELRCDGSGTCCRIYATTVFLPVDAARARSLMPDVLDGGHDPDRLFLPVVSSTAQAWEPRAVAMVDGRCAFLDGTEGAGRCGLHVAGGPSAKPSGCRLFPMRFVDDGVVVRTGPVPECRCVLVSARDRPTQLEPPELSSATVVEVLPPEVVIRDGERWPRARYLEWAARASLRCGASDGVATLQALATELWSGASSGGDPSLSDLRERIDHQIRMQRWRSARDLARRIPGWLSTALDREDVPPPLPGEAFYLTATARLHGWALDGVPLATSLAERATRLLLARRLRDAFDDTDRADPDPALQEPIALVEAYWRAFSV